MRCVVGRSERGSSSSCVSSMRKKRAAEDDLTVRLYSFAAIQLKKKFSLSCRSRWPSEDILEDLMDVKDSILMVRHGRIFQYFSFSALWISPCQLFRDT